MNEREGNPNPKAPILATFIEKNGVVVVAMKMRDRLQQMRSGGQTKVDFKIFTGNLPLCLDSNWRKIHYYLPCYYLYSCVQMPKNKGPTAALRHT